MPADMTLRGYQRLAARTAYPGPPDHRLAVAALSLAGESGEAVDIVKKWLGHGKPRDARALKLELGDALWSLMELASAAGLDVQDIAEAQLKKQHDRYPNGFVALHDTEGP